MGNPETPKTLIRKEKIERSELDKNWEKIAKDAGLTDEEADVAVKFLNEIKKRFRPEAKGEKPRDYIESFWEILRDYNITLTLSDMDSLEHFPMQNKEPSGLKNNIDELVARGITSIDKLVEKLSKIYEDDKERNWKKYLVQKNIQKREILELLKSYVKYPKKFILRHYTVEKRIIERALYKELVAMGLDKKLRAKEEKGEKPTELRTTDRVFYKITNVLRKKDLGE
jgi:hypothetical protein